MTFDEKQEYFKNAVVAMDSMKTIKDIAAKGVEEGMTIEVKDSDGNVVGTLPLSSEYTCVQADLLFKRCFKRFEKDTKHKRAKRNSSDE